MRSWNRPSAYVAASLSAGLLLAACGESADTGDEPAKAAANADPDADGSGSEVLSLPELKFAFPLERAPTLMSMMGAKERTWEDTFDGVELTATQESIASLVSGASWMVMNEPVVLWPALEQEVIDGVIVGVWNDTDNWFMFSNPELSGPEGLVGATFSGGNVGSVWNVVAAKIMQEELGVDPADVDFVSIGGGSDDWVTAMLAGQVDAVMGQPRHVPLVEEAGGHLLYSDLKEMAQDMVMVKRETWDNNRDAVCAALGGIFEFRQWLQDSDEPDWSDKMDEVEQYLAENDYDTSPTGLDLQRVWETTHQSEFSMALDLGASAEAWDLQQEILSREGGEISPDFNWRDHVAFDCVWELQEQAGLPLNPDPDDL